MLSHSILLGNNRSELQFIGDLANLCKRHKISCGDPQDLTHLNVDLDNDNFRADLFSLCTAISHMAEVDLSAEQLLTLVVRAVGGPTLSTPDAVVELPPAATSAFLTAYETWTKREPDSDTSSLWRGGRDLTPAPSRPGPTLFYSAASRSGADAPAAQDEPPPHTANAATPHRTIPPNTPLENLTLNELKMYLEDIENRVSRIQPRLEQLAPRRYVSPEDFEVLEAQRLRDAKPPAHELAQEAELAPEPTLAAEPEPALIPEAALAPEPVREPEPALEPEPVPESVALTPEATLAPEPVHEPEPALELEPIAEPETVLASTPLAPESTLTPEAITPTSPELALAIAPPSPLVDPQQEATAVDFPALDTPAADLPVVAAIPHPAIDAARLRRLRIVNAVLTFLLIVICGAAAIFGYRYLHPQSGFFSDILHRFSAPLEKQSATPGPVEQPATAPKPDAAHTTTSAMPAPPIHANQSPAARDTHPPAETTPATRTSTTPILTTSASTPALTTPASAASSLPQPDTKPPAVSASPSPAPPQNQPANVAATPDTQNHPPTKLASVEPQPNPSKAEPAHPTPSPAPPPVASTTSAPTKPAETPTPAPITRTAIPANEPVAVPSTMMLTYVISAPKPVYPSYRHFGMDSVVNVEATISKDGKVTKARATDGALDVRGPAVQAVQEWRFRPFILNDKPVTVVTTFRFVFKGR